MKVSNGIIGKKETVPDVQVINFMHGMSKPYIFQAGITITPFLSREVVAAAAMKMSFVLRS